MPRGRSNSSSSSITTQSSNASTYGFTTHLQSAVSLIDYDEDNGSGSSIAISALDAAFYDKGRERGVGKKLWEYVSSRRHEIGKDPRSLATNAPISPPLPSSKHSEITVGRKSAPIPIPPKTPGTKDSSHLPLAAATPIRRTKSILKRSRQSSSVDLKPAQMCPESSSALSFAELGKVNAFFAQVPPGYLTRHAPAKLKPRSQPSDDMPPLTPLPTDDSPFPETEEVKTPIYFTPRMMGWPQGDEDISFLQMDEPMDSPSSPSTSLGSFDGDFAEHAVGERLSRTRNEEVFEDDPFYMSDELIPRRPF
ncbi:hypothetical protein CC1G_10053 [Coprinopsis cinerea okayama7|uniref:Uncharacterized protein n=1 Tax=Coprinopsis cinerea (strain Okayama-7 / 130 / ATCC MYA-4618 / FGSC 9003) TaxID=240176 RepID=A8NUX9_COPC7|nr:hypothetical protein CC1G_10053 [Coprinopsis cinerea okayama7\|eukprot:XP_001836559.1 hypothetical protein CC1G_10053 [Coprinopsis cinerea okayama7\